MRFAVYTRFSSDKQKDTSTLDQLRNCQLYADQNGWLGLSEHVYSDKGLSGTTRKGRAALERLLLAAAAKPRPFDCVLVDDTSRLARNKLDQAQIIADLEDEGGYSSTSFRTVSTHETRSHRMLYFQ